MPRTSRIDIPGLVHHVMVRGIERRDIFHDDHDRRDFLERLRRLTDETDTRCFAWVLMSNHIHLLLQPTSGRLSSFMRRILTGYAVTFNNRHGRSGHLFQNRYKSVVCDVESYFLQVVRYIHLNPLRAGILRDLDVLDDYPWCGHRELVSASGVTMSGAREVLGRFGPTAALARQSYRDFVADGISRGAEGAADTNWACGSGAQEQIVASEEEAPVAVLPWGSEVPIQARAMSLEALADKVGAVFGYDGEDLLKPGKERRRALARGVTCYLAVSLLGSQGADLQRVFSLGSSGFSKALGRGERLRKTNPDLMKRILSQLGR